MTTPVIHKWPKREIRGLLQELKTKEPVLAKYLEYAGDPWVTDFAELRPLMEVHFDEISHASVSQLDAWRVKGELKEINYQIQQLKRGRFFALVACDVHHCGFVTGAGLAVKREDAKQLAAKQALERLFFPSEPLEELRRCALSVRQHEVHAGARIPAIQAAETLAVLGEKLEDVHLSAFQPCGKAWQAAITCMCLEHRVTGPSADYDRNVAMALAGEMFMSRLRWYMRVPAGDPHEPELWASTWEQRRESLGKPWSGRTSVLKHEILRLQRLGKQTSDEDEILRLLPSESRWKTTQQILADAQALRCRRLADANAGTAAEGAGASRTVQRDFEVTPRDKDPRRPELRGALPIEQIRPDLGQILQDTQVLVVSGGTGSGKTTQLPQFLLDDWRSPDPPRVVVTQPRRIAAISVAERVAWERGGRLGDTVGYSVHGEMVRPQSSEGSIEYVTVGTLLRRAVSDITLEQCNMVIVDEVHERDLLTDFLLILLRELLPARPDMRLLLMSATLDVTSFSEYFNCPALQVQSESLFPVEEIHLEDPFFQDFVFTNALLSSEKQSRSAAEDNDVDMEKCLDIMDSSICSVVEEMSQRNRSDVGSILCFLPGWWEIRQMEERLAQGAQASKIWAIPLHSTLPKERQQQVFRKPPKGKVKVILGTNIAESSVTIGDVEVVIDSGLKRELTYDPKRRLSSLDTVWVSQSGAVQRRGRAGRVRQGRLLRLYSREQFDALPLQPSPEMQRCDLAQSCLQAVALGRDPQVFLASAIDPPPLAAVETAMEQLVGIHAVDNSDPDPEVCPVLLPIGEVLARLPLEPLLGRAALLGCILGIPEQSAALLVAAGGRTPFLGSRRDLAEAQRAFCAWSDPLAAAKALLQWERLTSSDPVAANQWAEEKHLSSARLANLSRDKAFLLRDMKRAGLLRNAGVSLSGPVTLSDAAETRDASAEVLETRGEFEESLLEVEQEEDSPESLIEDAEDSDALLATVLCSAYPGNVAMRSKENKRNFKLSSFAEANMSPASVNADAHETHPWWLYCDAASTHRTYMHSTTLIHDWQIALFGGLRSKTSYDQKMHTCMTLDHWLQVGGVLRRSNTLLLQLREQVTAAIAWKALDALEGGASDVAQEAQQVAETLRQWLRVLTRTPQNTEDQVQDESRLVFEDDVEEPEEVEEEPEELDDEELVEDLSKLTVAQLKDMLKEKGLKVSGRKSELVSRLSDD